MEIVMTRKSLFIGSAVALALAAGAFAYHSSATAQPYGMMGPGYGPGYGQGMMGPGYGPGMMGPGYGPGYGQGTMGPGYGPGMMAPGYGPGYGQGTMGPGYGPGYGQGMMGPGYGPGMMGPGYGPGYGQQGNLNLSTDDVKSYLERWIAAQGNTRLKVGEVKEKDASTIVADVVTKDNSLVQRFTVDRKSGFYRPDGS
jgi:hypothetical protein